jgi:hypothetical protein
MSTVRQRHSILLLFCAMMRLFAASPTRADSSKPFDPRSCFCWSAYLKDISIGEFGLDALGDRMVFIVRTPVTEGPNGRLRVGGEEIDLGWVSGVRPGPYLIYDQSEYFIGAWCIIPLDSFHEAEVAMTSIACQHTEVPGGFVPDDCSTRIPLAKIVDFARALDPRREACEGTATRYLGIGGPEIEQGCASGGNRIVDLILVFCFIAARRLQCRASPK